MLSNVTNETAAFCKTLSYVKYSIAVVGIISNIFIPITVMKSEILRCKSAGILMIALACTDILYLGCKIMWLFDTNEPEIQIHKQGYVVYFYILLVAQSTSHLLVVMTAINRYALICHPHTHHYVTSKNGATIQIVTSVTLSILGNLYFVFLELLKKNNRDFFNSILLIFEILPYFVTTILSVMVFRSRKKRQRKLRTRPRKRSRANEMEMQLTYAMISVVIAFIVLSAPLLLFLIIRLFLRRTLGTSYHDEYYRQTRCLLDLFRLINYGINFYLYLMYCKVFRHLFISKVLHLHGQQREVRSPPIELVELRRDI